VHGSLIKYLQQVLKIALRRGMVTAELAIKRRRLVPCRAGASSIFFHLLPSSAGMRPGGLELREDLVRMGSKNGCDRAKCSANSNAKLFP
jgi:hypothetical protein